MKKDRSFETFRTILHKCFGVWVAVHCLINVLSLYLGHLFLFLFLFTPYWKVVFVYILWMYWDWETPNKGGRRYALYQHHPDQAFIKDYFPIKFVKTAELNPQKNYLLGYHPHGVMCVAMFGGICNAYCNFGKLFPNHNFLVTQNSFNFKTPFFREFCLLLGTISADKESLKRILTYYPLTRKTIVAIAIGGVQEATLARPGQYRIILRKRKGFVKVALSRGCSLLPSFGFGEVDLFEPLDLKPDSVLSKVRTWIKNVTGLYIFLPKGCPIPKAVPITVVVGKPIDLPEISNPTEEEIDHYHSLYMKALQELFNEYKGIYANNPETAELEIVE